jgi:hypothetical protein
MLDAARLALLSRIKTRRLTFMTLFPSFLASMH